MILTVEKQIIEKLRRLLFLFSAVAVVILIYVRLPKIALITLSAYFVAERFLCCYLKSIKLKITDEKIVLKKGVIIKSKFFIPRKRATQLYIFKTTLPFFKIIIPVIKGAGFLLPLIPCSEKVLGQITEKLE